MCEGQDDSEAGEEAGWSDHTGLRTHGREFNSKSDGQKSMV